MFKYVGTAVELRYDTGYRYIVEYLAENRLRWRSMTANTYGVHETGMENYYLNQQDWELFTMNWIEEDGTTISQNLDFSRMRVYVFMTWADPSFRGRRAFLEHRGTIRFVKLT